MSNLLQELESALLRKKERIIKSLIRGVKVMTDKGDSKNFSIEIESIFGQEMFENVKK